MHCDTCGYTWLHVIIVFLVDVPSDHHFWYYEQKSDKYELLISK